MKGFDWSVSHVSTSIKATLLDIGKPISEAVSGYRGVVSELANRPHITPLPSAVYHALGILAFSVVRITPLDVPEEPVEAPLSPQQGHVVLGTIGKLIAVALILATLFGIDYLYRHVA